MTTFEILSIVIAALLIFGPIISIYIKLRVDVTEIRGNLKAFEERFKTYELTREVDRLHVEKASEEEHKIINDKLDKILNK